MKDDYYLKLDTNTFSRTSKGISEVGKLCLLNAELMIWDEERAMEVASYMIYRKH